MAKNDGPVSMRSAYAPPVVSSTTSHVVCVLALSVGARLVYLPPYSPDYNPIEQAFAKLKWLVRSAKPRTVDGLWSLLGRLLDRFSPTECRNYFRNSGYPTTSGKTL